MYISPKDRRRSDKSRESPIHSIWFFSIGSLAQSLEDQESPDECGYSITTQVMRICIAKPKQSETVCFKQLYQSRRRLLLRQAAEPVCFYKS